MHHIYFDRIASTLKQHELPVPKVIATYPEKSWMIQSDMGDQMLADILPLRHVQAKDYMQAMDLLISAQTKLQHTQTQWPTYTASFLQKELELFPTWYCAQHQQQALSPYELAIFSKVAKRLIQQALIQPQSWVHRDFHSRNLIWSSASSSLGMVDFQDAVWGPVTYDIVSLLKDCYIDFDEKERLTCIHYYQNMLELHRIIPAMSTSLFHQYIDWMGIQRHLKCLGIFARLYHRDGKNQYIKEMPRVWKALIKAIRPYPELHDLLSLLTNRVPYPCVP